MPTITIDGKRVAITDGESLLDACRRVGVQIPTLCHVDGLCASGACRICVVEQPERGLVAACATPAADGQVIETSSPAVLEARRTIVELLLTSHPDDCLYCARNGSCELQRLAAQHGIDRRRLSAIPTTLSHDVSSPAITHDPQKCILCGRCVRVCDEIQGVSAIDFVGRGFESRVAPAFESGLNMASCVNCGQCVAHCPTAALVESDHLTAVQAALADPNTVTVVQHAPAISVTMAEQLGCEKDGQAGGVVNAALRKLGFDHVFETSFAADLTVMEEGAELLERLQNQERLPMFTSCSPAWVSYVESHHPRLIANLSSCKSPQQMLGALAKSYFAQKEGISPERIFSVAIMPCTAKKAEASRLEHMQKGIADVDAALTTREFFGLLQRRAIEPELLQPEPADCPLGGHSSAGKLFGATGGVMEAALRSAHYLATEKELATVELEALRGTSPVKRASISLGERCLNVAVVSGLKNAQALLRRIERGEEQLDFIEVMSCPGGCIAGGGQPYRVSEQNCAEDRIERLYRIDRDSTLRLAHHNPMIQALYREYLGEPLSQRSHELLHTRYSARAVAA
jgi:NADP-reducing hydrogenase subunit HndD